MKNIGTTTADGTFLAPYVPSPEAIVDRMLEIARVGPGDTVYDLGAGDGRIVIGAAQRFGASAVGVELDDERFASSSARIRDLGLTPRARIVHGDLLRIDLRPATVVTLYQLPSVNDMLRPALERQLRPGARVVTLDFPVGGWDATSVVTGRWPDDSQHAIFLYTMGGVRKESATMADQRTYSAGTSSLELDGVAAGILKSSEGGDASADIVTEKVGKDNIVHKHLAGVKYSDIVVTFGTGMSDNIYDWIASTLNHEQDRRDGAIVLSAFDSKQMQRLEFFHALISEVSFPACDGSSKDAAFITVKMTPEYTRMNTGGAVQTSKAFVGSNTLRLLQANYRLTIDGLDCARVATIETFSVKQGTSESPVGEMRDYQTEPAALDISNLALTFVEHSQDGFRDWFNDFVLKGNNAADRERNGTLEYLGTNMKDVLFTLTFSGLGIFKLAQEPLESNTDKVRRVRAEMYCEQVSFTPGAGVSVGKGSSAVQASTGSSSTTSSSPGSSAPASVYVPFLPSVADKFRVAELPQELVAATPARLGRSLKFRS